MPETIPNGKVMFQLWITVLTSQNQGSSFQIQETEPKKETQTFFKKKFHLPLSIIKLIPSV